MHNNESLAKKVLIVDDEPEMIEIIARYLTFHGYEVVTAPDGKEGLAKAAAEYPDIILLDSQMPVMNGREMLEELRTQPWSRDIPVIMVTGRYEKFDIAAAAAYDISDYVAKPFDPSVLLEKISDIFASNQRQKTKAENA
ncbi:MAG: response regulator [Sedimentisphaerales bacterium]|jgi:CheY-like chemotaxis protein